MCNKKAITRECRLISHKIKRLPRVLLHIIILVIPAAPDGMTVLLGNLSHILVYIPKKTTKCYIR